MTEMPANDPRVYFAAERTLLAWLRTGLAVVGLGFVVARFGLFLHMARGLSGEPRSAMMSTVIGTAFVAIGAGLIFLSAIQHSRYIRSLPKSDYPTGYWNRFGVLSSILLALLAVVLGVYLAVTAPA